MADVLVGEQAENAVLSPPGGGLLLETSGATWALHDGYGLELVRDLAPPSRTATVDRPWIALRSRAAVRPSPAASLQGA